MKKLLTILIMVLLLCACSGGNGGKQENVTKVNKVGVMKFVPEEVYTQVEYFSEQTKDGSIIEKDVVFTKESGTTVGYAVMTNQILSEITDLSQFESFEVNGDTYYMYTSGNKKIALCQKGNDIYAVQLDLEESNELHKENEMQDLAATVTYTDSFDKTTVSTDLFDIKYTVDESLPLASIAITVDQDSAGNVTEKAITWKYGQDTNNLDYRFVVRIYRNKTLEDVLDADSTYLDETINGVDYKVYSTTEDHPYSYYTQHGNDVYQIRNNGVSSGWFGTTRSEESWTAFSNFLNTISFK